MLRSNQKTDGFLHVSDEYNSGCNLLKTVCTNKPNKKSVYGVEGTPGNFFIQILSLDSAVGDFFTWGYVDKDKKVESNDYIRTCLSFKTYLYDHQEDEEHIIDLVLGWDDSKEGEIMDFRLPRVTPFSKVGWL